MDSLQHLDLSVLSAEQVQELNDLLEMKREAASLYNAIMEHQRVGLVGPKHVVWSDSNNAEYLHEPNPASGNHWTWEACYLHQHYMVAVDTESIFATMKAGYYYGKAPANKGRVNGKGDAIRYFKGYVNRLLRQSERGAE